VDLGTVRSEVDVVGFGRPATSALARRLTAVKAAPGGHPLDPVTVIVPSNTTGLSARRLLTMDRANLANVQFVTPFRLAELLGASRLGGRRPLTNPVLGAAVRAALAAAPGRFAEVADHQATAAAVAAVHAELSRATGETRARIAAASARGAEVARLLGEVAGRLGEFSDEDDLARAAAEVVAVDGVPALGAVVWHLPGRLSPAMAALVRDVMAAAGEHGRAAVVLGVTGDDAADEAVLDLVRGCGFEVPMMGGLEEPVSVPTASRIVSVSDPDEEVRQVVREIVELVAAGTPLDRIVVFRPTAGSYGRTLIEQLDGAGIPHNGPSARRLADTVAGRTLLGALALSRGGWGRGDVLALLAEAPVRDASGRTASARRWDAMSRRAGVIGGLDDWHGKLDRQAAIFQRQLDQLGVTGDDAVERRRRGITADLDTNRAVLAFVDGLAAAVGAVDAATTWQGRAAAAQVLLARLLGPEERRIRWPELEVAAAQRVDEALTRLAALDAIDPDPSRTTFELALATELEVPVGRVGRFGQGVLVTPLATAVGHDAEAVFVLGMAEGTCPSFRRERALLPDTDRRLATAGELPTSDDQLVDQRRDYLAALAAGREHRVLLFPRGDLRGRRDRVASRWLLESAGALAGRPVFSSDVPGLPDEVVHAIPSYAAGVARAAVHGSVDERDVAALLATAELSNHPLATGDLGRGFEARAARQGTAFTIWDGNLAGHHVPSPATGTPLSPSRLEAWAACPFRYFLGNVLRLGERDDPERIVELSPAERGTLVHHVLEQFFREVLDRAGGPPSPDEAWTAADHERVAELAHAAFDDVEQRGLTGRPLMWHRTQTDVLADLDRFLVEDDEHRRRLRATPVQVEMAFGLDGRPPLTIELPSGRRLTFRGKADRVDRTEAGELVVLDYKTGSGTAYKDLSDPVKEGQLLQLGIYAEAARAEVGGAAPVDARYWMVSERGDFKKHGYPWTGETRQRFLDVAEAIVDGIESGLFPARPGEYDAFWGRHENCRYCEFDRVCPRDREDHERATAGAPELTLLDRLRMKASQP
jgi:RecB family exonuclease